MTDVPAARAGAVDLEPLLHAPLDGQRPHHALGGRRAADIAEADEQNPNHSATS